VLISTFDVSNVGNQILEAQVLGKPYITVNTGDTSQIIKHEQNGILVENADDIDGIAKAMIRLIDNPKLCNDMADSALAFGKENIQTWEQRMEKEISIVESRLGIMPK
jgi:glycosyltransferase involved in cell wall biosynthesis